jgi:hypothetical protein
MKTEDYNKNKGLLECENVPINLLLTAIYPVDKPVVPPALDAVFLCVKSEHFRSSTVLHKRVLWMDVENRRHVRDFASETTPGTCR